MRSGWWRSRFCSGEEVTLSRVASEEFPDEVGGFAWLVGVPSRFCFLLPKRNAIALADGRVPSSRSRSARRGYRCRLAVAGALAGPCDVVWSRCLSPGGEMSAPSFVKAARSLYLQESSASCKPVPAVSRPSNLLSSDRTAGGGGGRCRRWQTVRMALLAIACRRRWCGREKKGPLGLLVKIAQQGSNTRPRPMMTVLGYARDCERDLSWHARSGRGMEDEMVMARRRW